MLILVRNLTVQSWLMRSGKTEIRNIQFLKVKTWIQSLNDRCIRYPGGDCTSDIFVADMEKKSKL